MNTPTTSKGLLAAQFLRSLHAGNRDVMAAIGHAEAQIGSQHRSMIVEALKSTIGGITAGDAPALTYPIGLDFTGFLSPQTAIGRLALRPVPANCRVLSGDAAATAWWSGSGQAVPLSAGSLDAITVRPYPISTVVVMTKETLEFSGPIGNTMVRDALAAPMAAAQDQAFLDPASAGTPELTPTAVTYGAPSRASTGQSVSAIDADLQAVEGLFFAAGGNLARAVYVLAPRSAIFLAGLRTSGGALAFPNLGINGGFIHGLPAIVATGMPVTGSPGETAIALLDPSRISIADDGRTDFEIGMSTSLQMLDNPTNNSDTGTATTMVSMFQTGSLAVKITRWCNWSAASGSAAVLTGVLY